MPSFNIENSVAFVTGTSKKRGIGRAIVEALLKNGAKKVYASARDASQLDDLVQQHGGKVVAVALDVTDLSAIHALPLLYTDVTLLVNNAGYYGASPTAHVSLEIIKKEIAVNIMAPMALANAFASIFDNVTAETSNNIETKPSAIVNINSIASFVNVPSAGTYSASKAAAHSLTQAQRRDFNSSLVIGVYPGPIDTDMADGLDIENKAPSSAVGQAVVDALKNGTQDVFPDPKAEQFYAGWKADAKAMEALMAQA